MMQDNSLLVNISEFPVLEKNSRISTYLFNPSHNNILMHNPNFSPGRSKESLIAAVENGADAVYFGGTLFSAGHYASNFNGGA